MHYSDACLEWMNKTNINLSEVSWCRWMNSDGGISRYKTLSVLSSCSSEKVKMQTNKSGDAPNFYSKST